MSEPLPLRAHLDWLRKLAKERLAELRSRAPESRLGDAQLAVAREYGCASWRELVQRVKERRDGVERLFALAGGRTELVALLRAAARPS